MAERIGMTLGVCCACIVSLLVAVINSPLLPLHPADKTSDTTCLRRNLGTPPDDSIRVYPRAATDDSSAVDGDVMGDDKEDECGHTTGPGLSFSILPPPLSPKRSAKPIIHYRLSQASWVLRC